MLPCACSFVSEKPRYTPGEKRPNQCADVGQADPQYGNASILKDGKVVFNICGNEFRLVVWINYEFFTIYIRFIGTHREYDQIDAQTI